LIAPLGPWAFVRRPTRSWVSAGFFEVTLEIGVDDIDAHATTVCQRGDQGTQRFRGAPSPTDDPAEVLRIHTNLENLATGRVLCYDMHVVRVINDSLDEMFKRGSEQD
jgi:hypothetical protein